MNNRDFYTISHINHLSHLTRVLPLIVAVFIIQCFLVSKLHPGGSIGNYALLLGGSLSFFLILLIFYDSHHKIHLFSDHLEVEFKLFGKNKMIKYSEIKEIITVEDDASFSSMLLKLESGKKVFLHFMDTPQATKKLIMHLKKVDSEKQNEDFRIAA